MNMIDEVEEEFSFDETLFDKLCSNTPFNLQTSDYNFNESFLKSGLKIANDIEIIYSSNQEKSALIHFILIDFIVQQIQNCDEMRVWEVVFIDTSMNFDLNYMIKQVVNILKNIDPSLINHIPKILKRIHYAMARDNLELCYHLKAIAKLLRIKRQIRLFIFDCLNIDFEEKDLYDGAFKNKRKSNGFTLQDLSFQINELVQNIQINNQFTKIICKRDYYKFKNLIQYNQYCGKYEVSQELQEILKSNKNKRYLIPQKYLDLTIQQTFNLSNFTILVRINYIDEEKYILYLYEIKDQDYIFYKSYEALKGK